MPNDDPLTLAEDARQEARKAWREARRENASNIVRPAIGKKMTKAERMEAQRVFLGLGEHGLGPTELEYDELAGRFQLDPDRPIPRRFLERAVQATQELKREGVLRDDE